MKEVKKKFIRKIEIRHRNSPNEWTEVEGIVDLGSLTKPNKDILELRISVFPINDLHRKLFGDD